jgi:hypothetical protein
MRWSTDSYTHNEAYEQGSQVFSLSWLPQGDREDIVEDLRAMRDAKVCRSADGCNASEQ